MRDEDVHPRVGYIRDLFANEDEHLKNAIHAMKELKLPINIGPEDGKLFRVLIKMISGKKAVEFGTLVGYSAIWIARALGEGGKLYSLEKNSKHAEIAENLLQKAGLDEVVDIIIGDAKENMYKLSEHAPFDFIFIDANKAAYPDYLLWSKKHLRSGGVIIADNTYLFDSVYLDKKPENLGANIWNKMKEFNQIAADDDDFESIMIPTSEGLTILLKK